ncbi:hypothetical protein INR49_008145, partial [Caranx melampygus]
MSEVKVKKETNLSDPAEVENSPLNLRTCSGAGQRLHSRTRAGGRFVCAAGIGSDLGSDRVARPSEDQELCQQFPHGITDQVIQNDMPHLEPQQRAMAINKLLSLGQLDLLRNSAGLLYRMKDTQTSSKMKGSDNQEKLVYQIIEDAGNKESGAETSASRATSSDRDQQDPEEPGEQEAHQGRQVCGCVQEEVYMLYNLQPDRSVTGGAWYSDQDFESEFVEAEAARDSKQSPMVQRNSSFATSHESGNTSVSSASARCPQVDLSMDDIETILNTLIYDGKVEMTVIAAKEGTVGSVDGQMKLYRGVNAIIQPTGLVKTPCGLCPVFDDCHEGGEISPSNCVYMSECSTSDGVRFRLLPDSFFSVEDKVTLETSGRVHTCLLVLTP